MIFKIVILRIFFWPYAAAEYFSANPMAGNTMAFFNSEGEVLCRFYRLELLKTRVGTHKTKRENARNSLSLGLHWVSNS